ncbi:substance-K receptor-like [Oculina patagonica]
MQEQNYTVAGNATSAMDSYELLAPPLFTVIIIVGFIGNTLLIYTVLRWKEMRTPCNYLIANNAVADLCLVVLAAPLRIVDVYHGWPLGEFTCQLLAPTQDVFVVVSVLTYTIIAWERHRAVVEPFKAKLTLRSIKIAAVTMWVMAYLCTGLPIAFLLSVVTIQGKPYCIATFASDISRQIYESYLVTFFIVLPLLLQTYAYSRLLYHLRQKNSFEKSFRGSVRSESRGRNSRQSKRRRLIRVTIILIVVFQVCYIPRGVMMLLYEFANEITTSIYFQYIDLVLLALYYGNHVINPIILFTVSTDFRSRFPCRFVKYSRTFSAFKRVFSSRKSSRNSLFSDEKNQFIINKETAL